MNNKFESKLKEQAGYYGVGLIEEQEQDNQLGGPVAPIGDLGMAPDSGANNASPTPGQGAEVSAPSYDKPLRELASMTWDALETDYSALDDRIKTKLHAMKEGATTDDNKATAFFGFWRKIIDSGFTKPKGMASGFSEMVRSKVKEYNLNLMAENDGAAGASNGMDANIQSDPAVTSGEIDQQAGAEPVVPQPPQFDKPLHYIAELTYAALETDDTELEESARKKIYNLKADSMKSDQQAAEFFKTWDSIMNERNGVIPDDER